MSIRSFISVNIPSTPGIEQTLGPLAKSVRGVTWVKIENLHFTLKFLGDVEEQNIEDISSVLSAITSRYNPFSITLRGIGAFPNDKRPRVVWIGVEGSETMAEIQSSIENDLSLLGFKREERPFSPHLTIGRIRLPGVNKVLSEKIAQLKGTDYGLFEVKSIYLMRSDLSQSGARYSVISEFPL
ncbi:MAG: RNA 2',3'-cyclic phosphodiesterase [Nitrospirae bacterium]|nr:RNA 2',3'-cyclic phosphodiesterase [Nitrospirota bacterium]